MSPLLPETRIAITPSCVALAQSGNYREVAVGVNGHVLDTLSELLREVKPKGRARLILSHEYAHVNLLQAPRVVLNDSEMQHWAQQQIMQWSGDAGSKSRIAWEPAAPGKYMLVASMDEDRLGEWRQCMEASGLRLTACQPWISAATARLGRALGKGLAWLALVEHGRITLARLQGGAFCSLRSSRFSGEASGELAALLARECLLSGIDARAPVWIESTVGHIAANAGLELRQPASAKTGLAAMAGA